TIGWIRYYEDQVAKLDDDKMLVWGTTKMEDIGASEFEGTNTVDEAKPNLWLELLFRERKHLHELQKTYIAAGLAQKKLEMEREIMDRLELAITNTLISLGHNPRDPEIRRTLRTNLMAVAS